MRTVYISIIFLFCVMSCENQPKPVVDIQGHRGCRGLFPENTLIAFENAVKMGVHTLELDLAVSKDGIVVVSHEPFMSQTICSKPNGEPITQAEDMQYNLYQMTFDSIQQFDCGLLKHPNFPEQIKVVATKPSLTSVLAMAESLNPNIKYNIELKADPNYDDIFTPKPAVFVNLVLEVIQKHAVVERTNLQSFDLRILEEIKRQSPTMKVAVLIDDSESIWKKTASLSFKPEIVSPYYKLLDAKTVENLKADNFQVIPWTVNSIKDMQQMIDFGVNGIITDYPDRLVQLLEL